MRGDYPYTIGGVDAWWNVYSHIDLIQRLGGRVPFFGGRTNAAARNIAINAGWNPITAHSRLHTNRGDRFMWEFMILNAKQPKRTKIRILRNPQVASGLDVSYELLDSQIIALFRYRLAPVPRCSGPL